MSDDDRAFLATAAPTNTVNGVGHHIDPMHYDAMACAFHAWLDKLPAGYVPGVRNPGGVWFDAFAAGAQWRNIEVHSQGNHHEAL